MCFAAGSKHNISHLVGNKNFELARHDVTKPMAANLATTTPGLASLWLNTGAYVSRILVDGRSLTPIDPRSLRVLQDPPGALPEIATRATSTSSFSPKPAIPRKHNIGQARLYRRLWSQRLDLARVPAYDASGSCGLRRSRAASATIRKAQGLHLRTAPDGMPHMGNLPAQIRQVEGLGPRASGLGPA